MNKRKTVMLFIRSGRLYGKSVLDRIKIVYLLLRWKLGDRWRGAYQWLPPVLQFSIIFKDHTLNIVGPNDPSFAHVFYEVFSREDYRIATVNSPKIIFDVGAQFGLTSLYFSCLFPCARIYSFEPSSDNFRFLSINARQRQNITPLNYGLYSDTTKLRLYLADRGGRNSVVKRQVRHEIVHVKALDDVIRALSVPYIDILKVDVEGAEEAIFEATTSLDRIGIVIGELHLDVINKDRVLDRLTPYFEVSIKPLYPLYPQFVATAKKQTVAPH